MRPVDQIDDPTWQDITDREVLILKLRDENVRFMRHIKILMDTISGILQHADIPEVHDVLDYWIEYGKHHARPEVEEKP